MKKTNNGELILVFSFVLLSACSKFGKVVQSSGSAPASTGTGIVSNPPGTIVSEGGITTTGGDTTTNGGSTTTTTDGGTTTTTGGSTVTTGGDTTTFNSSSLSMSSLSTSSLSMSSLSMSFSSSIASFPDNSLVPAGDGRAHIGYFQYNLFQPDYVIQNNVDANSTDIRLTLGLDSDPKSNTWDAQVLASANQKGLSVVLNILPGANSNVFDTNGNGIPMISTFRDNIYADELDGLLSTLQSSGASFAALEVGNEYDWYLFNSDLPASGIASDSTIRGFLLAYTRMLTISRQKLDKYFPGTTLLTYGSTSLGCGNDNYKDGCIPVSKLVGITDLQSQIPLFNSIANIADGYAVHSYIYPNGQTPDTETFVQNLQDFNSQMPIKRPIYVTEFGISGNFNTSADNSVRQRMFEKLFMDLDKSGVSVAALYIYCLHFLSWGNDSQWAEYQIAGDWPSYLFLQQAAISRGPAFVARSSVNQATTGSTSGSNSSLSTNIIVAAGDYRFPNKGIVYDNGAGHYCSYVNMSMFDAIRGTYSIAGVVQLHTDIVAQSILRNEIPDGDCSWPAGNYGILEADGTIGGYIYNNGTPHHYCWIYSGNTGGSVVGNYPSADLAQDQSYDKVCPGTIPAGNYNVFSGIVYDKGDGTYCNYPNMSNYNAHGGGAATSVTNDIFANEKPMGACSWPLGLYHRNDNFFLSVRSQSTYCWRADLQPGANIYGAHEFISGELEATGLTYTGPCTGTAPAAGYYYVNGNQWYYSDGTGFSCYITSDGGNGWPSGWTSGGYACNSNGACGNYYYGGWPGVSKGSCQ